MRSLLVSVFLLLLPTISFGQIKLPRLISNGMVLQRDQPVNVWGWASPYEDISVFLEKEIYKTRSDSGGNWSLQLPPQKAGGPFSLFLKGSNELTVNDIFFGDVWLCSGQSNMVLQMERVKEKYPDEILSANFPNIRFFTVQQQTNLNEPEKNLPSGAWKKTTPTDILNCSAVAYFFAKSIHEKYKIPIGIINSSVGGTPIESWISEAGLKNFEPISNTINLNKDTAYVNNQLRKSFKPVRISNDVGDVEKWYDVNYKPKGWKKINIPGYWEDQGIKDLDGIVWYRRELDMPENRDGSNAKLFMGRIVDADSIFVNGTFIGNITYQYPPRRYEIPNGILHTGKNTIAIKVINYSGKGGFVPDKPYYLIAGGKEIDLKGEWQYKVGEVFEPEKNEMTANFSAQNQPTALYNGMIAPLKNISAKGVLWYQGESNTSQPENYVKFLPALINDWRKQFNRPELPFIYVQLANFLDVNYLPSDSKWAVVRDAQLQALSIPNTRMAVAIDLGEWNDVHPLNKKEIGQRLSLAAQNLAYDENNLECSGPIFRKANIEGDKIRIQFNHSGTRLISNDAEPLRWFSIAGADKKFVWAKVVIENDEIIISSERVPNPVYVRYAWADNPDSVNFYNKEGLPASPFRTDTDITH